MDDRQKDSLSRRRFLENSSAVLAAAAMAPIAAAAQKPAQKSADKHGGQNETEPGPRNAAAEQAEPDSVFPPETDAGGQPPFKYSFAAAHRRIEEGGWTRQVTVRDLPISKKVAGVEMRLVRGGIRELHWHVGTEWAFMTAGMARITCVEVSSQSEPSPSASKPRIGSLSHSGDPATSWIPDASRNARPRAVPIHRMPAESSRRQ